ncbi:MAG: Gfo/Idh/MocA family oxidoreductase [Actinomycetia bacterium]|nr:Gfo/Idh/MocA family oxidoreductase [Actinomycetes bacterium]
MKVGIIGCGFVFDKYMATWGNHPDLVIGGVTDIDHERIDAVTKHYGFKTYANCTTLLADPDIDIIANFTPIGTHYQITKAALEAGKHVYSEKPLCMRMDEAYELIALAENRGLRLSCAPSNLLGGTSQTMWKAVADGAIGDVRLVYAEFDSGPCYLVRSDILPEDGFPYLRPTSTKSVTGAPFPWIKEFEMGCTYEHVGYHLTWMCAMFGPVESVTAFSKQIMPDKTDRPLDPPDTPDFSVACLDFHSGVTARITCSIAGPHDLRMRIIGDRGILSADTYDDYEAAVYLEPYSRLSSKAYYLKVLRDSRLLQRLFGLSLRRLPLIATAPIVPPRSMKHGIRRWDLKGNLALIKQAKLSRQDKCFGIAELAAAVAMDRPHFPSHAFTLHLTELTLAIQSSGARGEAYMTETSFDPIEMPARTRESGPDYNEFRKARLRARVLGNALERLKG